MKTDIKTIDVTAKEWFDKVNGNSYFTGRITVNYGLPDERGFILPFQYGYGSQYEYSALDMICNKTDLISQGSLSRTCREYGIILRRNLYENCRKRDVLNYIK